VRDVKPAAVGKNVCLYGFGEGVGGWVVF